MTTQTITLKIGGMECGGCVKSVQNALSNVPGVLKVEVSLDKATATLQAAETVRMEPLIEAVTEAGFDAEPLAGDN
ncbi:MAG: heavy-metal-associated domain-containing protein [Fimbriimonadia bacterium]|nr:heavy-metal-associated domain-containing protein [Fimbriimonadia bacterium]